MQPVDFGSFFEDVAALRELMSAGSELVSGVYHSSEGAQFRDCAQERQLVQDIVRLSDDALLFACERSCEDDEDLVQQQVISQSDWLHFQFRLSGGGRETVSSKECIDTPEHSCIVTRYPKDAHVKRILHQRGIWRWACIFISPLGLARLLDTSASRLSTAAYWIAAEGQQVFQSKIIPLQPRMSIAVGDVLSCTFRGASRRAYMRGKSLELIASVIQALDDARSAGPERGMRLSSSDRIKIARARMLMMHDLESTSTLAALSRRVGLSRTKLALGFKEVFGNSVQAFWRDAKLAHAREMLNAGRLQVTEIALSLGYSQLSSFTRAFTKKFGVLPKDCRSR